MEVKNMRVKNKQVTLYRCQQCLYIPTWVSDPQEHEQWHRLREEQSRELDKAMAIAAGSLRN
ncbi:MAG: hypothetical protein A2038_14900 [Deltaproteobacteria bacterium GWA2_57_13]|nr:MAG: hypothetical protein A2038_14900 [Deltaproteobacteria bacterium GWA2_57_13]OGQ78480.1 MAG: hypothetical protein A3G40_07225 [Deltaproteobacteria bacterium RIFCSPLOWO2_12_FULL_57_22]